MYDVLGEQSDRDRPETKLLVESLKKEVARALHTLTARESEVLRFYFGIGIKEPLTLEEIGFKYELTRERVRQIKEKAIRKLKNTSRSKMLKKYLG